MPAKKKKVAVLGGGVGAMTAVFQLTQAPDWDKNFDITVYQLGWRLGGKGASGRNAAKGYRIEEHGLHVWGGYYDNAFRVLGECYDALERPESCPIRTMEEAFRPIYSAYLTDRDNDNPDIYKLEFPPNNERPGTDNIILSPLSYLRELLYAIVGLLDHHDQPRPHWDSILASASEEFKQRLSGLPKASTTTPAHAAAAVCATLSVPPAGGSDHSIITWLLEHLADWLGELDSGTPLALRPRTILAALYIGGACAKGMIVDDVIENGFDSIDDIEWTAWAMKHGAPKWAMETGVGRCSYDYVFGSLGGKADFDHRDVAAGVGMRGLLRLLFTYKGALFYKMNAGMGDIVFAPFYEVLRARGVKFQFFHRVERLALGPGGHIIGAIEMARQVKLSDRKPGAEYNPLINVDGLPCWPSEPLYDQLAKGAALKASGANLESSWCDWEDAERFSLRQGTDFDVVLLGLSIGSLPYVAKDIIDQIPEWAQMVEHVKTVPTQAMQFWIDRDLIDGLGGPGQGAVLTAFYEPLDTWADMSYLLPHEDWPAPGPKQISYFCSVFEETTPPPPLGPNKYPAQQLGAMKSGAKKWVAEHLGQIMPKGTDKNGKFDLGLLHDERQGSPQKRFDAQYFRVNIDPSERYVQSVTGSTKYRLSADEGKIDNMFLAGDWLRTGLNAGCVEAAAMGGLQAARTISGIDVKIVGEDDYAASPLAAQNSPPPWSGFYATGNCTAAVITAQISQNAAQSVLPAGLKLMEQSETPPGTHPAALIMTAQRDVGTNFLPSRGMFYNECVFAIPYVTFEDPNDGPPGPFMVFPHLYLNGIMPTLDGRLWYGYPKTLARVSGTPETQQVAHLISGKPILNAELSQDGPLDKYYSFRNIRKFMPLVRQPVITRSLFGNWMYSYLSYDVEIGRVAALSGKVTIYAGTLGLKENLVVEPKSIRQSAHGAFKFVGGWTLTNPFESHLLKKELAREAPVR